MSGSQRISNGADYIESLRGRCLRVYQLGERVENPVEHPILRPSINAMAASPATPAARTAATSTPATPASPARRR